MLAQVGQTKRANRDGVFSEFRKANVRSGAERFHNEAAECAFHSGSQRLAHEAVTRGGFGAELAAVVQHGAFDYLDAPIERVGAKFAPLAFAPAMEQWVVPHAADVLAAVKRTVARA